MIGHRGIAFITGECDHGLGSWLYRAPWSLPLRLIQWDPDALQLTSTGQLSLRLKDQAPLRFDRSFRLWMPEGDAGDADRESMGATAMRSPAEEKGAAAFVGGW